MKRVLLRFFSANNLGDDLFVKVITDRYVDIFTTFVNCYNPSLDNIGNLHTIRRPKLYYLMYKMLARVTHKRNLWLHNQLLHNDLLLYVGGSIFQQEEHIQAWHREELFYQQCNKPYYILGSNVGPYRDKEEFFKILRSIFSRAFDVCFRDTASYDEFKSISNIRVASDVVFTLNTNDLRISDEGVAVFSIINCRKRFDKDIYEEYESLIVELTERLVARGQKVCYVSFWNSDGDTDAAIGIHNRLCEESKAIVNILEYSGNINEVLQVFASCSFVVATRFHATILGLLLGKRVLPIAYSDKTTNILYDMGFTDNVIDINNIDKFDMKTFDFDQIRPFDISDQVKLAEKQFQMLDKVLTLRK